MRCMAGLLSTLTALTAGVTLVARSSTVGVLAAEAAGSRDLLTPTYPALHVIEAVLFSTASQDFAGDNDAYAAALYWHQERLLTQDTDKAAPYLMCTEYGKGLDALQSLRSTLSPDNVRTVSHSEEHGACFIATAYPSDASLMLNDLAGFQVDRIGPFLSNLKLAPSLLDHGLWDDHRRLMQGAGSSSRRMTTTHGKTMSAGHVQGLSLMLSPGAMRTSGVSASELALDWRVDLMSENLDMHSAMFWSDQGIILDENEGKHKVLHPHVTNTEGLVRVREWTRAAQVVHGLAHKHGKSPGEICSWDQIDIHHINDEVFMITGIDHLLPSTDERPESAASDGKIACFMGLLSHFASKNEVLRLAPHFQTKLTNAVAGAVVESAIQNYRPLRDAGLNGNGEVIQIVDSGLDENSCYFAEEDGTTVDHGFIYQGIQLINGSFFFVTNGVSYPVDLSRRKVVQYIELVKEKEDDDDARTVDDSIMYYSEFLEKYYGTSTSATSFDDDDDVVVDDDDDDDESEEESSSWPIAYPDDSECGMILNDLEAWYSYLYEDGTSSDSETATSSSTPSESTTTFTRGYDRDEAETGHGTHTAGTAAGATYQGSPFITSTCGNDEFNACAGQCMTPSEAYSFVTNEFFDIETYCPTFSCDGFGPDSPNCLSGDVSENLIENNGVAPGAKLAIFDVAYFNSLGTLLPDLAGNYLWEAALDTGAKIHSNSWGGGPTCEYDVLDYLYDLFMYENPENLLLFSAGNSGGLKDINEMGFDVSNCTLGSPATAKNVLTIGSTSNGPSRAPYTGSDGRLRYEQVGLSRYTEEGYPWICIQPFGHSYIGLPSTTPDEPADFDTRSYFSSYGHTLDGRIKPELVAPGEKVFSASGGRDGNTCQMFDQAGTSMACPAAAGGAALVRQYFTDESFYASDISTRGICNSMLPCRSFSPTAATVKAMMINSANLMGGGTEPDKYTGFGRVHLEAGMPLHGEGDLALFVADSSNTSISENSNDTYHFQASNGSASLELRATLSWLDPPAYTLTRGILSDLDLIVTSPSGEAYTMWASGVSDTANVNERVIIPADQVENGRWKVTVRSKALVTETQDYSLVVTGAVVPVIPLLDIIPPVSVPMNEAEEEEVDKNNKTSLPVGMQEFHKVEGRNNNHQGPVV